MKISRKDKYRIRFLYGTINVDAHENRFRRSYLNSFRKHLRANPGVKEVFEKWYHECKTMFT